MRASLLTLLIAITLFITIPAVFSAETTGSPDDLFALGTEAFGKGQYRQALQYYQRAEQAGLDTAALHYNLGVTYFKLERYAEASREFGQLTADPKLAPLATYNLGLITLARGDETTARKYFQSAFNTATDRRLRSLAANRLGELSQTRNARKFSGFVSFAAGYDDNVALDAGGDVAVGNISDGFWEFLGAATGQVTGTGNNGMQLKATGYYLGYLDANEFDFGNFRIGPEIDRQFGEWRVSLGGFADFAYIGRNPFERIFSAELTGSREIYPNLVLRLRYQPSYIHPQSPYERLMGSRHRITVGILAFATGANARLDYTAELNRRDDADYPTRHRVRFLVDTNLNDAWSVEATGDYRFSQYPRTGRRDNRAWFSGRILRKIPLGFRLYGKYDRIQNFSSLPDREYASNIVSFGLENLF